MTLSALVVQAAKALIILIVFRIDTADARDERRECPRRVKSKDQSGCNAHPDRIAQQRTRHGRVLRRGRTDRRPILGGDVMKQIVLAAVLLVPLFTLGACGTTTTDRALSGGGIGAGAGALGGFLVGAPIEGALIGGALGAGAGALTKPEQINLGKPIWR